VTRGIGSRSLAPAIPVSLIRKVVLVSDIHPTDKSKALFASVLALAVGGLTLGTSAGCKSSHPDHGAMETSSMAKHACKGMNGCKGQGGCSSSANGCAGKNGCKALGGCATAAKHGCAGMNACKAQGGCKSGDNGCAGKNSCKGKGGCAVPVKH